ncbi:MAG: RNA polymerase sporulation sigma factor SigK [Firmicutes bacterium]|nr:RNA polymerase sporulation sigma factor SigK [Bacillota bacterium]
MRIFGFWQKIFGLCEQNNALYHKFVGYISNNIFPPLLTAEEEAEAISLAASGDDTARRKLIEHNLRLVAHICRKYESTGIEKDDLISLGTIGLIKGVNTFRPDKGSRLSTYAARCIDNEILMYLRQIKNSKTEVSLYDSVGTDKEGNEITLLDLLDGAEGEVDSDLCCSEDREQLLQAMRVLDAKEKYVLILRYGLFDHESKTQREIAAGLGISRSYVSRIEKRAVNKLKRAFNT